MFFTFNGRGCGPRGFHAMHGQGGWGRHGWGEQRGGGRGRRRVFDGGELRLVLLKLISEQPRHGYDLIREIEERTGGAYAPSPGVIYPTLTLLEDMGLIDEEKSEGAKKLFSITKAGEDHLNERREEVDALFARLAEMGAMRARTEAAPVRRAMGNLKSVLQNRLAEEEVDIDLLHQVAALIDEAAQKIERLK
ncbi:PadR family transcriptional regulator [Sphingomonas cavernae]|uniref:PadR family transcriptional regulator n=2 Tax=Sphingomonas cavernae TaxID=2320861 RepID=A0A418W745_9SPHN|nr:PadR family transcriptional regulator [Sphingomonas cavernae]